MNCAPRSFIRPATILTVLVLMGLAATAQATIENPPVMLRAQAPLGPLAEGADFAIPVDIFVRADAALEGVDFRTDARSAALSFEPVVARMDPGVAPGYRHERRILQGRLEPGLDRVRLQVTVDGEVWEESFSLRGFGDRPADDAEVVLARSADDVWLDPEQFVRPDPVPSGYTRASESAARAARAVTVTGRLTMLVDGVERGVDGASVYFMQVRPVIDDLELGSTTTDVNGNYTINASMDGTHDVYVKVRTVNSAVNVGTDVFFGTWGRNFPTQYAFSATSLDLGTRRFSSSMNHALWLLSTYTRVQRWYSALGFTLPQVNCRWWDDVLGSSCYLPIAGMEGIHLRSSADWNGSTVVHEYGHHFVNSSSVNEVFPPYYLNEICDPGHCGECPENEAVAWSEGLPHFLQQEFASFHRGIYGWSLPGTETFESVGTCLQTGLFAENAPSTEDFLAALLNDLIDSAPDGSSLAPGVVEHSELELLDILEVASTYSFSNSLDFVTSMRDYLSGPGFDDAARREFWAAAAVNGFAADDTAPTPGTISVPTHQVGVVSPSSVPVMFFSGATDDNSGVALYRVDIAASSAPPGPGALAIAESTLVWPTPLAEGTYYINYSVVDRAGNETAPQHFGPMLVGPAGLVDLAPFQPGLWEDSFLIRHDTSVTASAGALEPILLPGQDLWMSLSTSNATLVSASVPAFLHRISVDGVSTAQGIYDPGVMLPNAEFQILNAGPFQFTGGRHHVAISLDEGGNVSESDEHNVEHRYVVVRPELLGAGPWQGPFPNPPRAWTVGFDATQDFPNVAGHRITPVNQFAGVMLSSPSTSTDNALLLFPPSTGSDTGFETPIAVSDTREGQIEVMVVDKAALGLTSLDLGVQRRVVGTPSGYSLRHVSSVDLLPGADTVVNWSNGDLLSLLQYTFTVVETGPFTVEVQATFSPLDLHREIEFYWIAPGTGVLRPLNTTPDGILAGDGSVTLELTASTSGTWCLAIFRDLRPDQLAAPATITVNTDTTPMPDLAIFRDQSNWDLPFLPSFEPIVGPKASIPGSLVGGGYDTYLNYALANTGQLPVANFAVIADLDGVTGQQFFYSELNGIGAQSSATYNDTNPVFVSGGRHTMVLQIDPFDEVPERNEANNSFAMQFGWTGPDLVPFSNLTLPAPPDPEAGQEFLEVFTAPIGAGGEDPVEVRLNAWYPNADGFRLPAALPRATSGNWSAAATMPGASSDVDVQLHEVMPAAEAYGRALTVSGWGPGQSDFVLVDRSVAGPGAFDVSVVNGGGTESYTLVNVVSQSFGDVLEGYNLFGPMGIDGPGFLQLYEVALEPGSYQVSLVPQSNDADLGLSLYFPTSGSQQPFWSKDDGRDRIPMAFDAPAGSTDTVQFDVRPGQEGMFCLAIWKVAAADLPANQDYSIEIDFAGAAPECIRVDGTADVAYGPAKSVQTLQTSFGNSDLGQIDAANGSELDQAFATICDDVLHVTLTGNLESNYNDLELFIDSGPGGQNRLLGNNPDFGTQNDLGRMGDDGSGNGFTFDPGFAPDWWFHVQGGFGEAVDGMPYRLVAYKAELPDAGGGEGTFLGGTVAGSRGLLGGTGSDPLVNATRVAIDNSNTTGVGAGTGSASGQGVITGVELSIPLSEIGSPTGCLRLVAFVNGKVHDYVSNQFLPPLPTGTDNLGDPRDVDLGVIAGDQWFVVCPPTVTATPGEVPAAGSGPSAMLHAPMPNPFNPRTTIAFSLPRGTRVDLALYDVAGRRVRTLIAGEVLGTGRHELVWEGRDDHGRQVASGSYLLRLVADGQQQVRRVTLLK